MEKIYSFIESFTPAGFRSDHYIKFLALFVLGALAFALLARLIFGKKSKLNGAISASIAILCIYVVNVVVYSSGARLQELLSPLPFVHIQGDYLMIFPLLHAEFRTICAKVLDMVILAFLMNLLDSWLPKGKGVIGWFFFRILSVVLAICLQYIVNLLLSALAPAGLAEYAPMILMIVLISAILLGALKLLVGGALAIIDPLLGILYTFFFSNIVGKQLSKAILTTALLTGLICFMNYLGISSIYIASAALMAYLPLLIIVLTLWYFIAHVL